MTIDRRTKKIQAELEVCKERADSCMIYFMPKEVSEIYLTLVDISFQTSIPEELKTEASEMAKHLSIKYGSIHV